MTTIAFDGKSMVGDGRVTSSSLIITDSHCKVHDLGDQFVGIAGDFVRAEMWLAEYSEGILPEVHEEKADADDGFIILLIEKDGGDAALSYNGGPLLHVDPPVAIGTGAEVATGAMLAGKSAKDAVKIAIKKDAASGGKLVELKL